ncbi:MAG: hypothetical protein KKA10_04235 [Euryarchaeota archaeon]|nr:hypothetical protein [Euryarchaeota archaeon]
MVNKCEMCGNTGCTLDGLCRSCHIDVAVTVARDKAQLEFDSMLDTLSNEACFV